MAAIRRYHTSVAPFADSGVLLEAWPVDFVDLVVMNSRGGGVFCLASKVGVGFFSTTFNSLPCTSLMPILLRPTTPTDTTGVEDHLVRVSAASAMAATTSSSDKTEHKTRTVQAVWLH